MRRGLCDCQRDVNIDAGLVEILRGLKAAAFAQGHAQPSDFVFQTDSGNPLLYRDVWQAFDLAATRAGLNDGEGRNLRPHDLRRTAASLLINAGLPAPYVAKQLGHTVQVLYSTYTGLLEAQEGTNREAHVAALSAFRNGS
jgi:integrase